MNRIEKIYETTTKMLRELNLNSVSVADLNEIEIITLINLERRLSQIRKEYTNTKKEAKE
jgi:hypothetical protein